MLRRDSLRERHVKTFATCATMIAVRHTEGAQYRDEIVGQPLVPHITNGLAHLTLEIAPRDVTVISRTFRSDR
jgi:hypothetical protein